MEKSHKDVIFQILQKEPMGLTIQDVSRLGKMNRFTVTIYIHELLGEGKITERKIGAYRLFRIKESK
jgi:predicted transcriptional regulator